MTTQSDFREVGEEFIAHYGKQGMRWGHRNAANGEAEPTKAGKKVKVTSADITDARARQVANINKMNSAADDNALASTRKGKAATQKLIDKHWDAYVKDSKVANKTTRGEKVGLVVLALIGGVGVAATMASGTSTKPSYYNDRSSY